MKTTAQLLTIVISLHASSQLLPAQSASEAQKQKRPPAPFFKKMGDHHHPVTTDSEKARRYFNQGMLMLFGFNHAEAIRSFNAVAQLDPDCAMAYWGIAYALGPNINAPMDESAVPKAWEALQKAAALKEKASERERAYIEALSKRYSESPPKDRAPLDQAYADAMRNVARQFPDDLDAATLFVEALMDTMPWDYWTEEKKPKPATGEFITVLRDVLRRNPNHPGANHFLIHALEAGPSPEDAIAAADRLRGLELGAGHLVHMPSHIYVRVGQYHDATAVNERAVRTDESYIAACRAQGFYPSTYYPHNLHFLWYATGLEGRSKECIATARKIVRFEREVRCGPSPAPEAERFRHLHYISLARFGRWDELLSETPPAADSVMDQAMWHYARGLALLSKSRTEEAVAAQKDLGTLAAGENAKSLDSPTFPATKILAVANEVLAAKVAGQRGNEKELISRLEKAVELQDEIPYMEPPYWYYSVRQSLGAAWLRLGKPAKAEEVFRADLNELPRNGWALYGLERSLRAQTRDEAADLVKREFQRAWQRADGGLDLSWF